MVGRYTVQSTSIVLVRIIYVSQRRRKNFDRNNALLHETQKDILWNFSHGPEEFKPEVQLAAVDFPLVKPL